MGHDVCKEQTNIQNPKGSDTQSSNSLVMSELKIGIGVNTVVHVCSLCLWEEGDEGHLCQGLRQVFTEQQAGKTANHVFVTPENQRKEVVSICNPPHGFCRHCFVRAGMPLALLTNQPRSTSGLGRTLLPGRCAAVTIIGW